MWFLLAFLSALFAALVSILAKLGLHGINSNLATAIRTTVVLILAWGIVLMTGTFRQLPELTEKNWWFLIASGLATGASWLFYFKALQIGQVAQVVAVDKFSIVLTVILAVSFLSEAASYKTIIGCILITIGTLFMI